MSCHFSNCHKKVSTPWQDILSKKFISSFFFVGSPRPTPGDFKASARDPKSLSQDPWPGLQGIDHTKEELQNIEDILPKQKFTSFFGKQAVEWNCLWIGIGAFFFEQVDCNSGAFLTEISKDFTPIWVLVSPWQFRKASTRSSISQGWSNQKFHELPTKHV